MPDEGSGISKEDAGQEARRLVYGDRAKTYGHPADDFAIVAYMWIGIVMGRINLLHDRLDTVQEINWSEVLDPETVAIMMTALKLARLVKSPDHHDSQVDTHGYMFTLDRIQKRKAGLE